MHQNQQPSTINNQQISYNIQQMGTNMGSNSTFEKETNCISMNKKMLHGEAFKSGRFPQENLQLARNVSLWTIVSSCKHYVEANKINAIKTRMITYNLTYPTTSIQCSSNHPIVQWNNRCKFINVSISSLGKLRSTTREPENISFILYPILHSLLNCQALVRCICIWYIITTLGS